MAVLRACRYYSLPLFQVNQQGVQHRKSPTRDAALKLAMVWLQPGTPGRIVVQAELEGRDPERWSWSIEETSSET
jgi:hypothetical protein